MPLHPGMHSQEGRVDAHLASLPPVARKKYSALVALTEDSAALVRVAMARERELENALYDLQRRRSYLSKEVEADKARLFDAEIEEMQAELASLNDERSKRNGIRSNAEQIIAQLRYRFLEGESIPGAPLGTRAYSGPQATPNEGESIADAVKRVRREIAAAQAELMQVRQAPLTAAEIKQHLTAEIDRMAAQGQPAFNFANGEVKVHFVDQQLHGMPNAALVTPSGSASKLLAWMFRDRLVQAVTAAADNVVGGISRADRTRRIRELETHIFGLEHQEESLVVQALAQGLEVHRRPYASPMSMLGLEPIPPSAGVLQAAE
jgi:hypothetical protein